MTKPKLLPSLCKQMSIVFEMTPEVLSGAERWWGWGGERGTGFITAGSTIMTSVTRSCHLVDFLFSSVPKLPLLNVLKCN